MSKNTANLEQAVARIRPLMPVEGQRQTPRERAAFERAFADLMKLIAPRVRHFIRQYGFNTQVDDAQQSATIALYRALLDYDPEKSLFTTHLNWQIRGELQSLRFRIMKDRRPSTLKAAAYTISLHSSAVGPEGRQSSLEDLIEDDDALARTEAGAADYLAVSAATALVDRYIEVQREAALTAARQRGIPKRQLAGMTAAQRRELQERRVATAGIEPDEYEAIQQRLAVDREILTSRIFGLGGDGGDAVPGLTKEQVRQVTRRAGRSLQSLLETEAGFAIMAHYRSQQSGQRPQA